MRATRESVVDRFAAMARGREHKIFAFEIANEGWQNGFSGPEGVAELRRLGKRLGNQTSGAGSTERARRAAPRARRTPTLAPMQ